MLLRHSDSARFGVLNSRRPGLRGRPLIVAGDGSPAGGLITIVAGGHGG